MHIIEVKGKPGKMKRQKKKLKRGERTDTYLMLVCRLLQSIERLERIYKKTRAFSQHVAFISCRSRLTIMLAGTARGSGEKGRGLGETV